MIRQRISLVALFFTASLFSNSDIKSAGYKELKYWYMCSQGINNDHGQQVPDQTVAEDKPNFNLPTINEQSRKLMTYDILQSQNADSFAPTTASAEQLKSLNILYRDLEVFCGDGVRPEANLAQITDRTRSAAGSAVHRKMLAHPLASSDVNKFKARQSLIRALVENEELLKKADTLCLAMAENEERLLSNWIDADAVSAEVINKSYFQYKMLQRFNRNPIAMEALTRLGNLGTSAQLMNDYITSIIYGAGAGYATDKYVLSNQNASFSEHLSNAFASTNNFFATMFNPVKYYQASSEFIAQMEAGYNQQVAIGRMDQSVADGVLKGLKIAAYGVAPVLVAAYGAWRVYLTKKILGQAALTKDAINLLQDKLIGLGNLVRAVQELESLAGAHPEVAGGLVSWQHVADLHRAENDDFASLVALLATNTFTGESSFFSLSGRVLAAHTLAVQERDKFAGAIELMGELDACVSAAKLYKQFAERRVHFCFAHLEQSEKPYIHLQGFWNPFVDYTVVVENDIQLGGSRKAQNVILTGSNTGGKSTVGLKGTLINLYFAHVFGIAPAAVCELSVFTDFSSYLHVNDDVASGESAFQAEINRANSLIKAAKSLDKNQFAFIVIDELFKGTSPEKGIPGARKVVQHLAGYDNVVFIIATHFKELTSLADEIDSIVNMKIEIFEDENGALIKPYKLEDGISCHNVADNLMEAGLDIEELKVA